MGELYKTKGYLDEWISISSKESVEAEVLYKTKGYLDEWIEKRVRGIAVRDELTDEWQKRGMKEGVEYSILMAEISKATFDMMPGEYKE